MATNGGLKVTISGPPSIACAVCDRGQVILGGSAGAGTGTGTWVGVVGFPHADIARAWTTRYAEHGPSLRTTKTLACGCVEGQGAGTPIPFARRSRAESRSTTTIVRE